MKVFKKVFAILCMVLALSATLFGCAVFKDGPTSGAAVVGNGGLAVMKDEYIYFANGYKTAEENYQQNKGSKIYYSAIYRVKAKNASFNVLSDGTLMLDEGSLAECDENGNLPGCERLVSKIGGFENTKLYIFGDNLYFTTPTNGVDFATGESNTKGLDIYRVNINGDGLKNIHTIDTYSAEKGQINFYANGNDVFGVFYDGTDNLSIYKNTKRIFKESKVTSLAMPYFETHHKNISTVDEQMVYYVADGKLKGIKVGEKESKEYATTVVPELIAMASKRLYYSQGDYVCFINQGFTNFDEKKNERIISYQKYEDYIALKTEDVKLIVKSSIGIELFEYEEGNIPTSTTLSTKTNATLLFAKGETAFFTSDNSIYMADVNGERKLTGDDVCKFDGNNKASITNSSIYYYKEYTNKAGTSVYLARVDFRDDTGSDYIRYDVCSRLEVDFKDKEETTEK